MPGHRLIGTTLAVVVIATLAACDGGDPMNPAPLQVPEPSLNIYIPPGPTSDVTLHILEINHPFKFFLSFTSPFTLRIPACPSGGCDYLYPSPTVTAGGVYPLGMVSPSGPQILVFRVLGCNPAYVNLCFYGATVGLGGDRYGFAFDPYSGEYDDLVFEVLYEPEDTLVVSLVLARDSVTPVIDRTFDPDTQYWHDPDTGQRDDTVRFSVFARWEPSGLPAAGASVEVSIEPVDTSGGHARTHTSPPGTPAGRPPGRLFDLSEIGSVFEKHYASDHKSLTLALSADGSAEALYRTSGLGGIERLRASVTAESSTVEAIDSVTILWPGLVEVTSTGTGYVFEGETNSHHPYQRYLAPGAIEVMEAIWAEYLQCHEETPDRCPMTGSTFRVDAASNISGGLSDIHRNWRTPHRTHRTGRDVDFNNDGAEGNATMLLRICQKDRYRFEGVKTKCVLEGTTPNRHFHVYMGDTHYNPNRGGDE